MNKPTRNDPLDALLYASAKSAGQNERSQYESASPENTLTDAEKKKIIRRAKDPRNLKKTASVIMKRAAVIVLVILSVSFTCAMSVDSVREALWHSIFENGTYQFIPTALVGCNFPVPKATGFDMYSGDLKVETKVYFAGIAASSWLLRLILSLDRWTPCSAG